MFVVFGLRSFLGLLDALCFLLPLSDFCLVELSDWCLLCSDFVERVCDSSATFDDGLLLKHMSRDSLYTGALVTLQ